MASLAQGLGKQGVQVDVFSRRHDVKDPFIVEMGEGSRLIHVEAGPPEAEKTDIAEYLPTFIENVKSFVIENAILHLHGEPCKQRTTSRLSGRVRYHHQRRPTLLAWDHFVSICI